jgi:GT2 family glycosyltransferase
MKIHVLIPVHNNRDITLKCLELLSKQTFQDFTVTVVDDGSTDGIYETICEQFPTVTVLRGDGNLWWAAAINMALEHVLRFADDDDCILTLNNDVTFAEDYLASLAKAASERPECLIGSAAFDMANPQKAIYTGDFFDWRTSRQERGRYVSGDHFNDNVNSLTGRGMLVPVKVFKKIGLFDAKRFPHYGADTEFSIRAELASFCLCVYYGAVLYADTSISGYRFSPFMRLTWKQAWQFLFDKKSTTQIRTRYYVLVRCIPRRYLFRHLLLLIRQIILILTSVPPLWHIKMLFRPVLERFRVKPSE